MCACGHISCVCDVIATHKEDCAFRRSATCSIPIECVHGLDVCPSCDICNCGIGPTVVQEDAYNRAMGVV